MSGLNEWAQIATDLGMDPIDGLMTSADWMFHGYKTPSEIVAMAGGVAGGHGVPKARPEEVITLSSLTHDLLGDVLKSKYLPSIDDGHFQLLRVFDGDRECDKRTLSPGGVLRGVPMQKIGGRWYDARFLQEQRQRVFEPGRFGGLL